MERCHHGVLLTETCADCKRNFDAALAKMPEPEEMGWVLETSSGLYWNGRHCNSDGFVHDIDDALRFARFQDAEVVRCWLFRNHLGTDMIGWAVRSTQHLWVPGDALGGRKIADPGKLT